MQRLAARPFRTPSSSLRALDTGDAVSLINVIGHRPRHRPPRSDRGHGGQHRRPAQRDLRRLDGRRAGLTSFTPESREKVQALLHDARSRRSGACATSIIRSRRAWFPGDVLRRCRWGARAGGRVRPRHGRSRACSSAQSRAQHASNATTGGCAASRRGIDSCSTRRARPSSSRGRDPKGAFEANPAVKEVPGVEPRRLVGQTFRRLAGSGAARTRCIAGPRARVRRIRGGFAAHHRAPPARTPGGGEPFVQDDRPLLSCARAPRPVRWRRPVGRRCLQIVERAPDGFVLSPTPTGVSRWRMRPSWA